MKYDSFVSNTANIDKFLAPDSTARRPNPETKEDRPRTSNQTYPSTIEDNINHHEKDES